MNKNLNVALKNLSTEQGFAIPIAVGLGLIMILLGVTMVVRSQGDQVTASAQKATGDSLAVAETGVTRVQSLLVKNSTLASTPLSAWQTEFTRVNPTSCGGAANPDTAVVTSMTAGTWMDVDSSDLSKGEFKILNYTYTAGKGTLSIQGRAKSQSDAAITSIDNSVSSLKVDIPVTAKASGMPGIWVSNDDSPPIDVPSSDISVNANIRVEGCPSGSLPDPSKISSNNLARTPPANTAIAPLYDGTSPSIAGSPISFPSLPSLPVSTARYDLPPIDGSNCYLVLPRIARAAGAKTGTTCSTYISNFGSISVGAVPGAAPTVSSGGPAATLGGFDEETSPGIYSYKIDSTSPSGDGDSLKLSNSSLVIDPPAGTKVVLYVMGKILVNSSGPNGSPAPIAPCKNSSGTALVVTSYINGGSPDKLEIYGSNGSTWGSQISTSIKADSLAMISAFIHAPAALVDISGGQIVGSVWAKKFKSSNSVSSSICTVGLAQGDVAGTLGLRVPSTNSSIGPVKSWQREEAL